MSYSNDILDELRKTTSIVPGNTKKKKSSNDILDELRELTEADNQKRREEQAKQQETLKSTVGTLGGDDDIAPLSGGKGIFDEGTKWYQGWVDKGALEDGYQFGDISKIVLGTMNDNRETVTKAVIDATENLIDTGAIAAGTVGRLFSKDFQQNAYDFAAKDLFKSQETSEKIMHGLNWIDPIGIATNLLVDDTEEASVMGDKSDGMLESIAHMAGSAALGRLGVPTWLTQGVNAFAPAFEEAKEAGATDTQAAVNAGVAAVAEVLIEKLSGGIVSGTGADDLFLKPIVNKISNKFVAGLVKFGGKTALEGVEEVATEFATDVSKRLTYDKEVFQSEDVFDRYVTTFLSGALVGMGGNAADVANTKAAGRKYATGMTDPEFSVVQKLVNDEVAKREANGKKVSQYQKNKIEAEVIEKMEKGTIKVEEIEEILGGDSYATYKGANDAFQAADDYKALQKAVKGEEMLPALQKEYDDLHKMKRGEMTGEQIDRETSLKSQIDAIKSNKSDDLFAKLAPEANRVRQLRDNMRGEVITKVGESRLAESYRELERSKQDYSPDMTKYTNEYAKKTVQNIIDSGLGDNSNAFHAKVDLLAKVSADTGVTYTLTNNERLEGTEYYREGFTTHGFNENGEIVINMSSKRLLATTAGHEVGHEFQKANLDKKYSSILRDYCIRKEGIDAYNKRISDAEEVYKGMKDTTAEIEVANDLLGEYIFNDENFIKHLSTADRNVFQKVYDTIKYMCKIATAGSEEKRLLEKAKHEFEKAWREISKTKDANAETDANGEAQYSLGEIIDENNNSYGIGVHLDSTLLDTLSPDERIEMVKEYVKELGGTPFTAYDSTGNAVDIMIAKPGAKFKNKNGKRVPATKDLTNKRIGREVKQEAIALVDELILTAEYDTSKAPQYPHGWLDKNGQNDWEYWTTYIQDKNNTIWKATLNVANSADGAKILYDISPIKKVGRSIELDTIPTDTKVAQEDEKVKHEYSMSKDSEGNNLTEDQLDFFKDSKVVNENGQLKVMYHGTPNGDFNVFKDGTYFTDNKEYADRYQNPGASSISSGKTSSNPKTFEVYLNIKKPFDINDAEAREIYINEYIKGGNAMGINPYLSDAEYAKIKTIDWTEGEDLRDFLVENGYDYDGLVLDEGADGGYGDAVNSRGTSWVVFSPEQVKDVGNTKPTSNPNIYFSMSKTVEETKDLMAIHNLHSTELLKQLQMGGMPYPSVAITKPEMVSHDNYGEISLILHKDAIDPKTNKYNKVYSADAYTPTFPNVDYEASEEVVTRITSKVNSLYDQLPDYYQRSVRSLRDYSNIDDELNRWGGAQRYIEKYADDYGLKQLYLAERGEAVPVEVKRTEKQMTDYQKQLYQTVANKMGVDVLRSFNERGEYKALGQARLAWLEQHGDALKDIYAEDWSRDGTITKEEALDIANEQNKVYWKDEINRTLEFINTGGVTVVETEDISSTNAKIDEKISDSNYKAWVENLFDGIEGQSGIRNGRDIFTPSGNRRSFSQTHDPLTVDNIVKAMRKENQTGQGAFGGGSILGASAQEYGSIAEIKRNSDKLGVMDKAEHDAIKDRINDEFWDIARRYANGKDIIDAQETIAEAVSKNESKAGIARYLKQYDYVYQYTDAIGDDIIALRDHIRSLPTPYFEAKPRRGVGFDEVAVFVIPRNADVKLKQELLNRGYNIAEYDPKVEGDRQNVVNNFDEYKFSLSQVGQDDNYSPYREAPADFGYHDPLDDFAPVRDDVAPYEDNWQDSFESLTDEDAPFAEDKTQTETPGETAEKPRTTRKELHKGIVDNIKSEFTRKGIDFDNVLKKAKNLSTFATVDNTPQRVMEKALGYKEGQILSDLTVNKVAQNETEGIKWLNFYLDRKNGLLAQVSKQYNIKPGSKKSAAAQMYAEGFYVDENNNIIQYGDAELAIDFPDAKVRDSIKRLARDPRIRHIYDDTLARINQSRSRNAYPEIPRLDNYFLHFRAMEDTFSRLGLPFNPNDIRAKDLPTDLNGVTADLKPGQPYFSSAMHRTGKRTSFDLLGGLEKYLTSAKNQIYHIDDIQNFRALRNYIADTYGQANGLEGLDVLSEEEAQDRIEKVYNSHLSTFAKFLNEEANILAGKTALIDRGLEGIIGRRGITFLDTVNRQVGANMVGFNISSSLTNILPVAQTFAKTQKRDFVKAFGQTVANKVGSIFGRSDGFTENSPVAIRRKGAERFYRTPFQKIGDIGYVLMSAVDNISTELIARTKYNELTRKGMDSQQAHYETDKWVSRLMGDRSLGQQPQLYNSKMLGLITKFQLEVRNQLDSQFYDTIQEAKVSNEHIQNRLARNAKTAAKVTSTFVQLAIVQHLFGMAFESVAGYNPAFDIVDVLIKAFGWDDDEESEDTALDNVEEGFMALLEDLPYTGTFTGGRIPISSALPIEELVKGEDEYGNEKSRWETLREVAPYYVLPGGYGQIKKSVNGLQMFDDDLPVAGSYTDSGNLRFPVEDTFGNKVKAGIFGQYANENARDYFDNERDSLKEKQIQEYIDLEMPIQDYWEYRDGLKKQETLEDKFDYIAGLDVSVEQKNIMINNVVDRKEQVDMERYDEMSDYEEFDFYSKNPEKYEFLEENGIAYSDYTADEDTKEYYDNIYSWVKNNPNKVTVAKAVTDDIIQYKGYTSALDDIRADKDSKGNSISGSAKEKKKDYIFGLDLDEGQKYILFKTEYPKDDTYNNEIIDYLNSRDDISYDEMVTILEELGFIIGADGKTITWD